MTYIACYLLGVISFGIFMLVMLLRVHRTPPPTFKHRRANRDKPFVDVQPVWERSDVGGIEYRFMGTTGLEE
jgi:hypothetical protein